MANSPDIRIGLIGLPSSGKTHLVAMLSDLYWQADSAEHTRLEFRDREAMKLLERAKATMLVEGKFIPATPPGQSNLYRMIYERPGNLFGFGGFTHNLDILDVSGESFLTEDETIYQKWLTKCNALIVIIDGKLLQPTKQQNRRQDRQTKQQIFMFNRLSKLITLHLSPEHRNKHKICVAFCVSKYDLFESDPLPSPEQLVHDQLFPVYEIIEKLRRTESDWMITQWYGFSSIGFVWDERGLNYADRDGTSVKEGKRVSQYYTEDKDVQIFNSLIIRPEGLREVFEDIREFISKNGYIPPQLEASEVMLYSSTNVDLNTQSSYDLKADEDNSTDINEQNLHDRWKNS